MYRYYSVKKKHAPFIILIFLSFVLESCSMTPEYKRPTVSLRESYHVDKTVQGQLHWDEYFRDKELKNIIEIALKNNRNLRQVSQGVLAARELYGIKKAEQLPTIGASGMGGRASVSGISILNGGSNETNFYQATLGVSSWELDFWGRLESLKEAALETYLSSIEGKRATELSLITQVATSYLYHRELQERLRLASNTELNRQKMLDIAKKRYKVGSSSKLYVNQVLILYNQARAEKANLVRMLEQNKNALTFLLGGELPELKDKSLSNIETLFSLTVPVGLPSELLIYRPDILSAEHQLKAANANIGAARAAFFPSISLTGSYGQMSTDLSDLFRGSNNSWYFAPSINIPLFTGGKLKSNLKRSQVLKVKEVAFYEETIQRAFREVMDILAQRKWLEEQLNIVKSTLDAQEERARITNKRYEKGSASYFEVLESERESFTAKHSYLETRRMYLTINVNLFSSLGGVFKTKVKN